MFSMTIKTASNAKALHQAIPSAFEEGSSGDKEEVFKAVEVDMFFVVLVFY